MLCTVWICITQSLAGPQNYNNFLVFRGVFDHLFSSLPLYEPYPLEYGDINHYGPIFAFIIAPFAVLPPWLGMSLWCMSLSLLLYWTVRQLPMPVVLTSLVLWLTLNDFYGACFKQQFNIAVAALVVGALAMIEKRREGWAALFIVIGTFVKIYGIVGLAFFFFVRRKGRFIGYMALWSAMALLLPLLFVSPEYLWSQYAAWAADIVQKNGENMFCAYTNISLVGCVRKISGSPAYSDLLIIVPAMVLFLLSYLRTGQYKHFSYRLTMLASLLLFIVLFSSGSEHSGYVIAALGMGIWWVNFPPPARGRLEWTLLLLALFASFSYNLLPTKFYRGVFVAYALRSLPFFAIWLHCIRRLWREDFAVTDVLLDYKTLPAADEAANEAAESRPARPGDGLDIVCPCYNPAPGVRPCAGPLLCGALRPVSGQAPAPDRRQRRFAAWFRRGTARGAAAGRSGCRDRRYSARRQGRCHPGRHRPFPGPVYHLYGHRHALYGGVDVRGDRPGVRRDRRGDRRAQPELPFAAFAHAQDDVLRVETA